MTNKISPRISNAVLIIFCLVMVMFSFFIRRKRADLNEAKQLPFFNTQVEKVQDGTYENQTKTSFMHLKIEVTVLNNQITKIVILENEGSRGKNVEPVIDSMISLNKAVVPLVDGEEIASLVFISCVDGALQKGLIDGAAQN